MRTGRENNNGINYCYGWHEDPFVVRLTSSTPNIKRVQVDNGMFVVHVSG